MGACFSDLRGGASHPLQSRDQWNSLFLRENAQPQKPSELCDALLKPAGYAGHTSHLSLDDKLKKTFRFARCLPEDVPEMLTTAGRYEQQC